MSILNLTTLLFSRVCLSQLLVYSTALYPTLIYDFEQFYIVLHKHATIKFLNTTNFLKSFVPILVN